MKSNSGVSILSKPVLSLVQGVLLYVVSIVLLDIILVTASIKVVSTFNLWYYVLCDRFLYFLLYSHLWFSLILCVFFQSATFTYQTLNEPDKSIASLKENVIKDRQLHGYYFLLIILLPPLLFLSWAIIRSSNIDPVSNLDEFNNAFILNADFFELLPTALALNLISPVAYIVSVVWLFNSGLISRFLPILHHIWGVNKSIS